MKNRRVTFNVVLTFNILIENLRQWNRQRNVKIAHVITKLLKSLFDMQT